MEGHWELVSCHYLNWSKNGSLLKKSVPKIGISPLARYANFQDF